MIKSQHIIEALRSGGEKTYSRWDDWASDNQKRIEVIAPEDVGIEVTEGLMKDIYPNQCYFNAEYVMENFPGTSYVLGFANFGGGTVDHAWNAKSRKFFDLTRISWDYHRKETLDRLGEIPEGRYWAVVVLNGNAFKRLKNKVGYGAASLEEYFRYYIYPKQSRR